MIKRLQYGLSETGLQLQAPWEVYHAAAARRGALLSDIRRSASGRVHQVASKDKGAIVDFDLAGRGAKGVFEILQQLEDEAALNGMQDPRISTDSSYDPFFVDPRYPKSDDSQFGLRVDFERPEGVDGDVGRKIEEAMVRYAVRATSTDSSFYRPKDMSVEYSTWRGITLAVAPGAGAVLTTADTHYSSDSERIRLIGPNPRFSSFGNTAVASLVALTGVVSTLREVDPNV